MSFTKYMLDELREVVQKHRKKTLLATYTQRDILYAIKQCLNLGCSKEDIKQTVEDEFNKGVKS